MERGKQGVVKVYTASKALKPLLDGAGVSQTQVLTAKSNKYVTLETVCIETQAYIFTRFFQLDRTEPYVS